MPTWVIDVLWFFLTWLFLVPVSVISCWLIVTVAIVFVVDKLEGVDA